MKTLLLTLVVVTIVCLDLAHIKTCYSCNGNLCAVKEECQDGQEICYKMWNNTAPIAFDITKGCAESCPTTDPDLTVLYCTRDNCNY